MRYLTGIKKLFCVIAGVCLIVSARADKTNGIPDRPSPPKLVNNLSSSTDLLSTDETAALEQKLDNFANETSNQIAIIVVDSLHGYDIAEYASEFGHEWKIGQKKFDNGVVILIDLAKDGGRRQVFIAPGKGLEGAIPDATCEEIVQNEILPQFKHNQYYAGLDKATDVLIGLAKGEYNSKDYDKRAATKSKAAGFIIALIIMLIVFVLSRRGGGGFTLGNSGIFFWGGGFGGFGGGGGGGFGGGGGGGFGGFGGGDFGGGGAGGSW